MGYPHGADHLPCRDQPQPSAAARVRRFRGAKRGANVGRRQATPGDNGPWFVQLDGPSGHTQQRAATWRMRLKGGKSAIRLYHPSVGDYVHFAWPGEPRKRTGWPATL
jgi:hypothetical protein